MHQFPYLSQYPSRSSSGSYLCTCQQNLKTNIGYNQESDMNRYYSTLKVHIVADLIFRRVRFSFIFASFQISINGSGNNTVKLAKHVQVYSEQCNGSSTPNNVLAVLLRTMYSYTGSGKNSRNAQGRLFSQYQKQSSASFSTAIFIAIFFLNMNL